ncbi:MAG: hypothetical protein BAJALOKI2v1_70079 [Promethearchaeota archaeon]|nr:MAG: hypothetical protein BAJALOKI2v1_70079 [Candidatus Lokiarchaeota archaeon]
MFYCSAAEGARFQEEVTKISEKIEKLGKNPFKTEPDSKSESKGSGKGKKKKTE